MTTKGGPDHIISNAEVLSQTHIPEVIVAREVEIRELQMCMEPALKRRKPVHAWLWGPSGSGKTLAAMYVIEKLENQGIPCIYANCWEHTTLHSVMDAVCRDLKILGAEKMSTSHKLEKFQKFLSGRPCVLMLDEIDMPMPKDRNVIIYNLCELDALGIICISTNKKTIFELDERVRSRLNPRTIEFTKYSTGELYRILKDRAESALSPESYNATTLKKITALASGNARIALQTLLHAANFASADHSEVIKGQHLEQGWLNARDSRINQMLNNLTIHHKLFYNLIKTLGQVTARDLWAQYIKHSKRRKITPIATRTFSLYLIQMISLKLIKWHRAPIRGNIRIFELANNNNNNFNMS